MKYITRNNVFTILLASSLALLFIGCSEDSVVAPTTGGNNDDETPPVHP